MSLKLQKESLRFIDAFVTPSFSVTAELIALGIDRQIIHMIPDGVDIEKFHKATPDEQLVMRENLEVSASMKVVLYGGRFDVLDKNLFTILRVWGEIQRKHNDAFLVLADINQQASAENQAKLISFIRDHGLDGCVNCIAGAEASAKYLRIADIFVMLEDGVAADTILLEAMACELPIIATFNQETDKLIKQGQNGLLVEKDSFQQLFDTIETLILHAGGAKRLGKNARKTIEHTYAAESVAEAYSKLFCSISQSWSGRES
jgi:glycosyltransferase involved in cell wall biosynthesis